MPNLIVEEDGVNACVFNGLDDDGGVTEPGVSSTSMHWTSDDVAFVKPA